jgi:hypothetical protein
MESSNMNRPLVGLVSIVVVAGLGVLAFGATRHTTDDLKLLLLLIALGGLAERYAVGLFNKSQISVGVVTVLVAAAVGGYWGVALVAPVIVIAGELGGDAAWYKRLYNVAAYALAGAAFAGILRAFGGRADPEYWPDVLLPGVLGALANFLINSILVATAIALSQKQSPLATWRASYQWMLPQYLVVGLAAVAAATAYQVLGLWALAVFAAPVAGIRHAYFYGATARAPGREPDRDLAAAA